MKVLWIRSEDTNKKFILNLDNVITISQDGCNVVFEFTNSLTNTSVLESPEKAQEFLETIFLLMKKG